MNLRRNPGNGDYLAEPLPYTLSGKPASPVVDEYRRRSPSAQQELSRPFQVFYQSPFRLFAEGHDSFLVTLSPDDDDPFPKVYVLEGQGDRLAYAQAARVDELKKGAVANAVRRIKGYGREERVDLRGGKHPRKILVAEGGFDIVGGIVRSEPLEDHVTKKRPQRGDILGQGLARNAGVPPFENKADAVVRIRALGALAPGRKPLQEG